MFQVASMIVQRTQDVNHAKHESLLIQLQLMREENDDVQEQMDALAKEISVLLDERIARQVVDSQSVYLRELKQQVDDARRMAGLTDVMGEGVILILNDANVDDLKAAGVNVNDVNAVAQHVVHDSDIRQVLQELKLFGAQAISVNEERMIVSSRILCSGPTIAINSNLYAAPYVVKAIGDREVLYTSLRDSAFMQLLEEKRLRVSLHRMEHIMISGYHSGRLEQHVSFLMEQLLY